MEKNFAKKLVKDVLQHSFEKRRYAYLVRELLNHIEETPETTYRGNYIPDAYKEYVTTLDRIGKYVDPDGKKIDILIVHLKKETSLERARTMQRNFVAWFLKRRGEKDAALAAFTSPDQEDWRFSFVKMEYKFVETPKGYKAQQEFTPARRFSFLVGKDETSHTAQKQLVPFLLDDDHCPALVELEEAFSIEKVTKEFFLEYRKLFLRTKEELDRVIENGPKIKADFKDKGVDTVNFAKKLLGQIVFLYFLQKKGWFGVGRDDDWGSGPKNFLRQLYEGRHAKYENFFNDILEPLFYNTLAVERTFDYSDRFNCKIPFLNGGLFDPINNYDWVHTDILLPNELFSNDTVTKEGDIGTGILDAFDRYNFTVKEDEPLEKEVAVDPEMLGKVFENLLELKDRKSKGTYYTPREIVHYMCQQSLINYLTTELGDNISKDDIETLIQYGELAVEHDTRIERKGKETNRYSYKLPDSVRRNAKLIDEKLATIRICDPAIGSGAFPVGMMNEIVRTRNALTTYLNGQKNRTIYSFKRNCIQNSLYGVDIDPGAVEIAKLRLWLSLVVDEEDIKHIKPLPNLDYKIMQGNSLLEDYKGIKLFDENLISVTDTDKNERIKQLKDKQSELQKEYITLHSQNKLTSSKKDVLDIKLIEIDKELRKLRKTDSPENNHAGLFDIYSEAKQLRDELFRLHTTFFESAQKSKKDYTKEQIEKLEWKLIEATLKEQNKASELHELKSFQKKNTRPFFLWKLHFAEVFHEKKGFDIVIGNPPYLSAVQDSKNDSTLREVYRKKYPLIKGAFDIYAVFLIRGVQIINEVGSFTWIVPNKLLVAKYAENVIRFLRENGLNKIVSVSSIKVFEAAVYPIMIFGNKLSNYFAKYEVDSLEDLETGKLVFKCELKKKYKTFAELGIKVASGTTGFQAKQLIKYLSETRQKNAIPFVVSGSIDPYVINFRKIRYMKRLYRQAFISKGKEIADSKWEFWTNEKIIVAGMTKKIEAAYSIEPLAIGVGVYAVHKYAGFHPKFLLALLNSKFLSYYINTKFKEKHLAGGYLAINKSTIEQLPIVPIDMEVQKTLIVIVDKILAIMKDEDYPENSTKQAKVKELEKQIDQMVYKLYDLTPEEIAIVEGQNKTD